MAITLNLSIFVSNTHTLSKILKLYWAIFFNKARKIKQLDIVTYHMFSLNKHYIRGCCQTKTNTKIQPYAGLMLGQRRRHWPNINPAEG